MVKQLGGTGSVKEVLFEEIDLKKVNWVDLDLKKIDNKNQVRDKLSIPEIAFSALVAEDTRPRFVEFEQGMVIILRGVNYNPDRDPEDMVSLRVWLTKKMIVTFRKQNIKALNDVVKMFEKGEGPRNTMHFFKVLVGRLVGRISGVVSKKEELIDELDEIIIKDDIKELRGKLAEYRIDIISLKRYLNPLKETFHRILNSGNGYFPVDIKQSFIEFTDTVIRCIEDLDSFRERCSVIQEEFNTKINEKMNRTIYQMSIVATIFLPLSLLTGLLGINVGGIPGVNSKFAFIVVCIVLVVVAIIEYIVFKKKNVL